MKTAATEKSRSITFVYDSSQFPDLILWFGGATCRRHFAAFQRPTSRSYKMDLKTTVCWILVKRMSESSGLKSKQSSCGGNPGDVSLSVMHLIPWFPSFLVTFHCNLILKFAPGKVEKKEMPPSRGLMTMCSVRQETSLGEQSSKIFFCRWSACGCQEEVVWWDLSARWLADEGWADTGRQASAPLLRDIKTVCPAGSRWVSFHLHTRCCHK